MKGRESLSITEGGWASYVAESSWRPALAATNRVTQLTDATVFLYEIAIGLHLVQRRVAGRDKLKRRLVTGRRG